MPDNQTNRSKAVANKAKPSEPAQKSADDALQAPIADPLPKVAVKPVSRRRKSEVLGLMGEASSDSDRIEALTQRMRRTLSDQEAAEDVDPGEVKALVAKILDDNSGSKLLLHPQGVDKDTGEVLDARDAGFARMVERDLRRLASKRLGYQLLQDLAEHPQHGVVIRPTYSSQKAFVDANDLDGRNVDHGTASTVFINKYLPDKIAMGVALKPTDPKKLAVLGGQLALKARVQGTDENKLPFDIEQGTVPRHLILAHELIHARHSQLGVNMVGVDLAGYKAIRTLFDPVAGPTWDTDLWNRAARLNQLPESALISEKHAATLRERIWSNAEEFETIDGLGEYTENRFRKLYGLDARLGHMGNQHKVSQPKSISRAARSLMKGVRNKWRLATQPKDAM